MSDAKSMMATELLRSANQRHEETHKGSKMKDPDQFHPYVKEVMNNPSLNNIQKGVLINQHHAKQTDKVHQLLNTLTPKQQ